MRVLYYFFELPVHCSVTCVVHVCTHTERERDHELILIYRYPGTGTDYKFILIHSCITSTLGDIYIYEKIWYCGMCIRCTCMYLPV